MQLSESISGAGSKIHPNKSKLNSFDKTSKDGGNAEWWLLAITLAAVLGTTILYFVRQRQKKVVAAHVVS